MQRSLSIRCFLRTFSKPRRQIFFFRGLGNDSSEGKDKNESELLLTKKLKAAFPDSPRVEVDDVSGWIKLLKIKYSLF